MAGGAAFFGKSLRRHFKSGITVGGTLNNYELLGYGVRQQYDPLQGFIPVMGKIYVHRPLL